MEEVKRVLDGIKDAFEEYKKANDARLEEIEKGGSGAEFEEKLARIEKELKRLDDEKSALEAKFNRPGGLPSQTEEEKNRAEYRKAFGKWVRKGIDVGLAEMEKKTIDLDPLNPQDGSVAVPQTLAASVYDLLTDNVTMRQICGVITVGSESYTEPVNLHGAAGGWVTEQQARPATASPTLGSFSPVIAEMYAYPESTQRALDDIYFDVEGWLAREIAITFANLENAAFISGNGVTQPMGLLTPVHTNQTDAVRAYGVCQYIPTGVANNFPAANQPDLLIDTVQALKQGHRRNAVWIMNNLTLATVRKWKDGAGDYLWSPGLQIGTPSSLLGYPVYEDDDMPGVGAGTYPIAFGNFRDGYVIADRIGIRMLRDPYTSKPLVGFYTTKRVGGGIKDSEAIKLVCCALA